jgi:gluconolactonase
MRIPSALSARSALSALSALTALSVLAVAPPTALAQAPGTPAVEGRITRLDPRFNRLIPADAKLEVVVQGHDWVEGPLWDRSTRCLLYSDIPRNAIYRWCDGKGDELFLKPSGYTGSKPFKGKEPGSNGLTFGLDGRLIMAQHGDRRISRIDAGGRRVTLADRFEGKRLNSPNDVIVASNGDLLFTDPPWGLQLGPDDPAKEQDFNGVYRLTPRGVLTVLTHDLEAPNGIALSPDETRLFLSESKPELGAWYVFDVAPNGTLSKKRRLLDAVPWATARQGVPDGLKVDEASNVFGAGPGGVYVIDPGGTLLGVIETGGPTSNTAWGGDGSTLYITAGTRIFRIKTTTRGAGW